MIVSDGLWRQRALGVWHRGGQRGFSALSSDGTWRVYQHTNAGGIAAVFASGLGDNVLTASIAADLVLAELEAR